jgi:hypothetical protein
MIRKTMLALAAIGTLASSTPAALTAVAGTTVLLSAVASSPAAAAQCGPRVSVQGIPATGAIFKLKKRRAERRAKRGWRGFVAGERGASIFSQFTNTNHPAFGLGTRYADLSNARNVVINCKGGGKMYCTVTATPCTR